MSHGGATAPTMPRSSPLRDARPRRTPCSSSARATAAPIPRLAPVTTATLPSSVFIGVSLTPSVTSASMTQPDLHSFDAAEGFPNSQLPVVVHHDVGDARAAGACEELFARNGWLGAWADGIFSFHHFHSTAHEVLGVVAGTASVILGGPSGRRLEVARGDVLV